MVGLDDETWPRAGARGDVRGSEYHAPLGGEPEDVAPILSPLRLPALDDAEFDLGDAETMLFFMQELAPPMRRADPDAPDVNRGEALFEMIGCSSCHIPSLKGPDGPVPSLRLKYIRDGLEDYEYLWLLKQAVAGVRAGKRPASNDWLKRAEAALAVDASVVETSSKYTKDGAAVLAARREIARLLTEVPPVLADRNPPNP